MHFQDIVFEAFERIIALEIPKDAIFEAGLV
jgi:hypothetical protein